MPYECSETFFACLIRTSKQFSVTNKLTPYEHLIKVKEDRLRVPHYSLSSNRGAAYECYDNGKPQ